MSGTNTWSISGHDVTKGTAKYPDQVRDAIRWLFHYSLEHKLSLRQASDAVGYSTTTVYRAVRGEYEGSLDNLAEAILSYKRLSEQRGGIKQTVFIETATARRIFKVCDAALAYQSIAVIYGDSHIGKTWALLEHVRRNNHGRTKYVRLPAYAGKVEVIRQVGRCLGISLRYSTYIIRERIFEAVDSNNLVIVDELHQPFVTYSDKNRIGVLEFLRELYDASQCGMVLCGTNVARQEIEEGHHKRLLEQLRRRGIFRLQLPAVATWPDRYAIAKHFGLGKPEGDARVLVDRIIKAHGLKAYTSHLQAACQMAEKTGQEVSWDHFIKAHDIVAELSDGTAE